MLMPKILNTLATSLDTMVQRRQFNGRKCSREKEHRKDKTKMGERHLTVHIFGTMATASRVAEDNKIWAVMSCRGYALRRQVYKKNKNILLPLPMTDLTERVKSPGWLLLGRARKQPSTLCSLSRDSASGPEMLGWNHLQSIYIVNI